jgi:hypothetical protein
VNPFVTPTADDLVIWTITARPVDFPRHFVVRPWVLGRGPRVWPFVPHGELAAAEIGCLCATLTEARASVPWWCTNIGSEPGLDPVIVERWV